MQTPLGLKTALVSINKNLYYVSILTLLQWLLSRTNLSLLESLPLQILALLNLLPHYTASLVCVLS